MTDDNAVIDKSRSRDDNGRSGNDVGRRKPAERLRTLAQQRKMQERRRKIAARLTELRGFYNVEQLEIASAIRISPQRWHNYEKGKRPLDLDVVIDLCERYDINADWLLRGVGPARKLPGRR